MSRAWIIVLALGMLIMHPTDVQVVVGGSGQAAGKIVALNSPRPEYPPSLKQHGIGGKGIFLVYLDHSTGAVTRVEVHQSTGVPSLDKFSIEALCQ
jgi:hypothetical protein